MEQDREEGTALVAQHVAVVETASTAVAAREKAAVEARYLMALRQPRNPDVARVRLLKRCDSPRFADLAEYSKPVGGGKKATGGSIRLMEEMARQWGNIYVESSIVFDDEERRIIRVTATDLESNYPASVDVILEKTVERRSPRTGDEVVGERVNSQGQRVFKIVADEDAFLVKQNANVAKARREMIRAIVPGDLADEALERCATTRKSEVDADPDSARKRIADAFFRLGVMPHQLSQYLGKPSLEAVTPAELEVLRSIYTGIKDGETSWAVVAEEDEAQRKSRVTASVQGKTKEAQDALRDKLANGGKKKVEAVLSDEENAALDKKLAAEE